MQSTKNSDMKEHESEKNDMKWIGNSLIVLGVLEAFITGQMDPDSFWFMPLLVNSIINICLGFLLRLCSSTKKEDELHHEGSEQINIEITINDISE
mgnify:FL=1